MSGFFVEPEWLEAVRGSKFFYPSAFLDHREPLAVFHDYIDEFWFCDTNYDKNLKMNPALKESPRLQHVKTEKTGAVGVMMKTRRDATGKVHRYLDPSTLIETYQRDDGRLLKVVRRRGFGQIAIMKEFPAGELGVFMHRGDTTAEGGSNVYYLANLKSHYEPVSRLFEKISSRFGDKALVISDGSLTKIRHVIARRSDISGNEAFEHHHGREYIFGAFRWSCVGWLRNRNGPTLVWGLKRQLCK